MAQKAGGKVLAGPPEVGMPASGMITSERLIKENPQFVRRGVREVEQGADGRHARPGLGHGDREHLDDCVQRYVVAWLGEEPAGRQGDLPLEAAVGDFQAMDWVMGLDLGCGF